MDETLALLLEGYLFIKNRTDRQKSDVYATRLMGKDTICVTGREAAELFYDPERFLRAGAVPMRVQTTLTGTGTVQGLDGAAHVQRKALFMSLAQPEALGNLAAEAWKNLIPRWEALDEIVLFNAAKLLLCKIACEWAGVPLPETEIPAFAEDLAAMVDGFGGVGPRNWKGKAARTRTEDLVTNMIDNVRAGRLKAPGGSALAAMAGNEMDPCTAAKELLNLLRPITAISTYIAFMALALHENPGCKASLSDAQARHCFVQEVRRFYPFTPFVGAVVKQDFNWKGHEFKAGNTVLLDVYGINHDSRLWDSPFAFMPERFEDRQYDPFAFVPHGGGDPAIGHRCPGESITVEIMKATLDFLANQIDYSVPPQDLQYDMARIPARVESGFVLGCVRGK